MAQALQIVSHVAINGITVPVSRWEATMGTYGSVGHFSCVTDSEVLATAGLNLPSALENATPSAPTNSPSLPVEIWAAPAGSTAEQKIFGGDIDSDEWDFDNDSVRIHGRDYAGRLVDSRIVLASSEYTNKTPSQMATLLAQQAGLTPAITSSGDEQQIGFYFETDVIKLATPRQTWELLVFLARQVNGYEVHTTPNMELAFGLAPKLAPRVFTWKAAPNTATPIRKLIVRHNARRNLNFQVLVLSYHPKTTAPSSSLVIVLGNPMTTTNLKTIKAGMWKGSDAAHVRSLIGTKLDGHPTYLYYIQGLTPAQTEQKAEAIAADIWKRAYIVDGEIDGDPTIVPQMPIQIAPGPGANLQGFDAQNLVISSVSHSFEIGRAGARGPGFLTRFSAYYSPPPPYEVGAVALPPTA